ncbi:DUF550 domain-containing protein [Salmonella enterica subsp. enterica]|nr:DUF550 domain-containing protein [Salmonella enterica subsp. enterica serovar Hessarek]EEP8101341.1 DUF550 domain-containing protein [Salmonella enterica subsp. enterica]
MNNKLTDDVLEYVLAVVEDRYDNRKSNAGEDDRIILALRELQERRKAYSQPVSNHDELREQVRSERAEWSDATFGDVGPVGPLKHLSKEALEAAADPSDPLEWADMQFLLWDAQRRMGLSDEFITRAMIEKLAINKAHQWPEPKDSEPRMHIKEQPVPVVLEAAIFGENEDVSRDAMLRSGNSPVTPDGWIKCSDQTPKTGQAVIGCVDFDSDIVTPLVREFIWTGSTFRRGVCSTGVKSNDSVVVTHWMPLPAAPKKD